MSEEEKEKLQRLVKFITPELSMSDFMPGVNVVRGWPTAVQQLMFGQIHENLRAGSFFYADGVSAKSEEFQHEIRFKEFVTLFEVEENVTSIRGADRIT